MSIHAAKGLEFGVVCVADLGRAQNLGVGDLLVDGDRVGLRLARLDGSAATPSLAWPELSEERRLAQAEEEDRILYVAMTRARERLLLSGAVDFERWPEQRLGAPAISWLGPALSPELAGERADAPAADAGAGRRRERWDAVRVGVRLNAPETAGTVLRLDGPPGADDGPRHPHPYPTQTNTTAIEGGQAGDRLSASPIGTRGGLTGTGDGQRPRPLAPPGDPGPLDTLSYTSLTELARCSYRFYLERVLGMPEQRPPARRRRRVARRRPGGARARHDRPPAARVARLPSLATAPSAEDVAQVARELDVRVAPHEREELAALLACGARHPSRGASCDARSRRAQGAPVRLLARGRRAAPHRRARHPRPRARRRHAGRGLQERSRRPERGSAAMWSSASTRSSALLYALAVLSDGAPRVEIVHWFLHRPAEPVGAVFAAADRPAAGGRGRSVGEECARALRSRSVENPHRGLCLTCPGRSGLCSWSDSDTLRERGGMRVLTAGDSLERSDGELFARARAGDVRARERLAERYLPLARRLARRYQRSEEPLDDLEQVASLGPAQGDRPLRRRPRCGLLELRGTDDPRRGQAPLPRPHVVGAGAPRPPGAGAARGSSGRGVVFGASVARRP